MKRIGGEHRLPRSKQEWNERIRDAMRFEERTDQQLPDGGELVHRVGVLAVVALVTGMIVALAITPAIAIFGNTVESLADRFAKPVSDAELPPISQRSEVVDREGRILGTLAGEENRVIVPLSQVPDVTRKAVLAIEDAKFYDHHGVDLAGLVRALLTNVRSGEVRQGGSTITQQLVKNTIVGTERSLDRKVQEARLAVALEKKMSKNLILESYLNQTYFGNGVYGIGTASEFYFGQPVSKLTLGQSAMLAAVIKAPERYEPIKNAKEATGRRKIVLLRMADEGFISRDEAARVARTPLNASPHPLPKAKTPYFVEYVKQQILTDKRFGATRPERARALFQAGLRIETTLDLKLQEAARKAVANVLDRKGDPEAAVVTVEAATGAVRAIISGRNFEKEHYDLAVQGRRQPGSTFKPFTMAAALEERIAPSLVFDTPSPLKLKDPGSGKTIEVNNYDGAGRGYIDMRTATEQSVNTYYMQLIQRVGPDKVVAMAKKLGIESDLQAVPSLTLGTISVSPFELASAYATLANEGIHCKPFTITRVIDARGREILKNPPDCERRVPRELAARASQILRGIPERGTGQANGKIGRPVTGKTGTTDNYTNAWYAGYTPQYATVTWLGFLKDKSGDACQCVPLYNIHGLPKVFGGSLPAMIWNRVMRFAHRNVSVKNFPPAPGFGAVDLPDVRGKELEEAKKILDEAGFPTIKLIGDGTAVVAQAPGPGKHPYGVVVTLRTTGEPTEPSPSPSPTPKPSPTPSPTPTPTSSKKGKGG